jgi:hypothetical protein
VRTSPTSRVNDHRGVFINAHRGHPSPATATELTHACFALHTNDGYCTCAVRTVHAVKSGRKEDPPANDTHVLVSACSQSSPSRTNTVFEVDIKRGDAMSLMSDAGMCKQLHAITAKE